MNNLQHFALVCLISIIQAESLKSGGSGDIVSFAKGSLLAPFSFAVAAYCDLFPLGCNEKIVNPLLGRTKAKDINKKVGRKFIKYAEDDDQVLEAEAVESSDSQEEKQDGKKQVTKKSKELEKSPE